MSRANLLVLVQFGLFSILIASFIFLPVASYLPVKVIGAIMIVSGIIIFFKAIQAHSQTNRRSPNITPTPNIAAQLVNTGIYHRIRHPIYTGVILCGLGAALLHGHMGSIVIALTFIPFFTYKSTYEEYLLKQTYPQYLKYIQQTGRFIPPLQLRR